MQKPVKLSALIEEIESQMDEFSSYLNRKTRAIVTISEEEFSAAENDESLEDYPKWQHDNIKTARAILEDEEGNYVQLPTKFEIHEWQIMNQFALQVKDDQISEELQYALRGRGAFRMFKEAIRRHGIEQEWYSYKERALKRIAVAWCELNGIPFEDD